MPSGEPFGVQNPLTAHLDVGAFDIVSTADGDIDIIPDGTGSVVLGGTTVSVTGSLTAGTTLSGTGGSFTNFTTTRCLSNLTPIVDDTYTLGLLTKRWVSAFIKDLTISGVALFTGTSSGLARAEISAYNVADEITIAGIGIANKAQVTSFDANGLSLNTTPDHTNDHITIVKAGIYYCHVEVTADSVAGSAARFGFGVWKNNGATLFQNCHKHRNLVGAAGGNAGSVSFGGLIDLAISDTIEVWVYNEDNTQNISIDDITLTLIQVGGT